MVPRVETKSRSEDWELELVFLFSRAFLVLLSLAVLGQIITTLETVKLKSVLVSATGTVRKLVQEIIKSFLTEEG